LNVPYRLGSLKRFLWYHFLFKERVVTGKGCLKAGARKSLSVLPFGTVRCGL
jgi:hypothetical protein